MASDITLTEVASAPATPSANKVVFYVKSDGRLYYKDDAGAEIALTGAGGSNTLLDGSAHTDTLADTVTDGDVIIGNVTPKWSSLAISVPAADVRNILGVDNGELRPSWKAIFDGTNPAALGVAAPGTSLIAAHRDHVHLDPVTAHAAAADPHTGYILESLLDAAGDILQASADNTPARLAISVPAANILNVLGVANGETLVSWKSIFDAANPANVAAAAAPGTSLLAAHRDHAHLLPAGLVTGAMLAANTQIVALEFIIDGGGSAITTGQKGHIEIPFACTITGWTILADQSGSIVVDVWKDTYANFPPTVADTIAGTEKPTLTSAQKDQDLALGTWTTAVAAGDILAFNVDSITTVTRVLISIRATKT